MNRFRKLLRPFIIFVVFVGLAVLLLQTPSKDVKTDNKIKTLKIGWVTAFAGVGQIVQAFDRKNNLQSQGIKIEFKPYLIGPQMNEAALKGEIDGVIIGIVPLVSLLSATGDEWKITASVVDFLQSTLVSQNSSIQSIKDLAGKKVGVPFGTGAHPYILTRLKNAEISFDARHGDSARLLNIKPPEQPYALQSELVDAVASFEPITSIILSQQNARIIDEAVHNSFLMLRSSRVEQLQIHDSEIINALKEAILYVATNRDQADAWYAEASGFSIEKVRNIKIIDQNFLIQSIDQVDVNIDDETRVNSQKVADEMYELDLIPKKVVLQSRLGIGSQRS